MNANIGGNGGSSAAIVDEWNSRARLGVGIVFIVADQLFGEQCNVVDRTREQPDMIERARQRERAVARNQPMRRLETDDAAIRRRANGRAVGLAADRERHHVGADSRRRTARGAARSMLGIVRIARLARAKNRQTPS